MIEKRQQLVKMVRKISVRAAVRIKYNTFRGTIAAREYTNVVGGRFFGRRLFKKCYKIQDSKDR